ncbi:MAG: hypothetical protein H8E85_04655 [Candidatus Marinimicrobia bacterium]|nr:hypothetical protein [Candidatus Neomarinimicrobiota bacterium]
MCNEKPESKITTTLLKLNIFSEMDTILLGEGKIINLSAEGIYSQKDKITISNNGVLSYTEYVEINIDTIVQSLNNKDITWISADQFVAQVSNGTILGISKGETNITGKIDSLLSNSIVVRVASGEPLLSINPPIFEVLFQSEGTISGWVVGGELDLTINDNIVNVSENGQFEEIVSLEAGVNDFIVIAKNIDELGLSVSKTKQILYLFFDDIVGNWEGETLTRPFSFNIYKLGDEYLIAGTMTIDLTFFGGEYIVENIAVLGLINSDGTIDAELSLSTSDFSVTGSLEGSFSNEGTAGGSFTLSVGMFGVSIAHSEQWTAVKQ